MIYKRGTRYCATVYDPKRKSKSWVGTFDSRAQALAAIKARTQAKHKPLDCRTFVALWLSDYPRPKDSTNAYNAERVSLFAQQFGNCELGSISRGQARRFALENPGRLQTVRGLYADAVADGYVKDNPFANLRLPKSRGRKDLTVLTEPQVAQIARNASELPEAVFGPLIMFAAYSGLRRSELFGLRWTDIKDNTINVARQYQNGCFQTPKNARSRRVLLTAQARQALDRVPPTGQEIFLTARGKHLSPSVLYRAWRKVRIDDYPFHGLRHFYGTWLANKGAAAMTIAHALGHRDGGKLALERYIHQTESDSITTLAQTLSAAEDA